MERAATANESARMLEAEHETAKEVLAEQQRLREATEAALLSQEEAVARERAAREECDRLAQLKRVAQAEERSVTHTSLCTFHVVKLTALRSPLNTYF